MAEFRLFVLFAILLLPECLVAQHGTANNGYYPSGYQGDTWTGIVSSLDTATKAVSLVHTHKGKSARFEGVLAKGYRVQAKDEKEKQQIRDTGIAVGAPSEGLLHPKPNLGRPGSRAILLQGVWQ